MSIGNTTLSISFYDVPTVTRASHRASVIYPYAGVIASDQREHASVRGHAPRRG